MRTKFIYQRQIDVISTIKDVACVAGARKWMGEMKKKRARGRHARGEGAPARKAPENRFPPPIQLLGSAAWSVKSFDRKLISLRALKRTFAGNSATCRSIPAVYCKQNQIADQNKKREILIFSVVYARVFFFHFAHLFPSACYAGY